MLPHDQWSFGGADGEGCSAGAEDEFGGAEEGVGGADEAIPVQAE